jgi:hypothetical protein
MKLFVFIFIFWCRHGRDHMVIGKQFVLARSLSKQQSLTHSLYKQFVLARSLSKQQSLTHTLYKQFVLARSLSKQQSRDCCLLSERASKNCLYSK